MAMKTMQHALRKALLPEKNPRKVNPKGKGKGSKKGAKRGTASEPEALLSSVYERNTKL